MLNVVVLPAPFGPSSPTISPRPRSPKHSPPPGGGDTPSPVFPWRATRPFDGWRGRFHHAKISAARRPADCVAGGELVPDVAPFKILAGNQSGIPGYAQRGCPRSQMISSPVMGAQRVFNLRGIAGERNRFVRHAILHLVKIDHFFTGRMIGLAFFIHEINDHIRLGDDVVHAPAGLRQIGGQPFAASISCPGRPRARDRDKSPASRSNQNRRGRPLQSRVAGRGFGGGRHGAVRGGWRGNFNGGVRDIGHDSVCVRLGAQHPVARQGQQPTRQNIFARPVFHFIVFSITVCTWLEMVRKESFCRHKKPSPSTRNFPSPACNCKCPGELAMRLNVS